MKGKETEKRKETSSLSTAAKRKLARKARCVNTQSELSEQQKLVAVGTSTVVEGFLSKFATGVGQNWKRRYFRLHRDGQLEYYDDAYTIESKGCLQLLNPQGWPQYTVFETEPPKGASKGHHFELQPVNDSELTPALLLVAESAAKRDMWIDRICTGFARRSKPINGPGRNMIAYRSSTGSENLNDNLQGGEFGAQVVYKGKLWKEGHIRKSWKERYFVLYENGLLAYYSRRSVSMLKGEMRLWTRGFPNVLKIEVDPAQDRTGPGFGFGWKLEAAHEQLILVAKTAEEREQWLYKIQLGIFNNCQDTHRRA